VEMFIEKLFCFKKRTETNALRLLLHICAYCIQLCASFRIILTDLTDPLWQIRTAGHVMFFLYTVKTVI